MDEKNKKNMKKMKMIIMASMLVLAVVFVSGCIGDITDPINDDYVWEATIQGETFGLPEGFNLTTTDISSLAEIYLYSDGTDESESLVIAYYPLYSTKEILSLMKDNPSYSNIKEDVTLGGQTGFTANFKSDDGTNSKIFIFEKGGKVFGIELTEGFNFEESIPKIIK